jgi:nucleoside-diphosphate-sugar epimerase
MFLELLSFSVPPAVSVVKPHSRSWHGWRIRALSRTTSHASGSTEWEWVKGDALDQASVLKAAAGVKTIVHAVNPPGYRNWAKLVLPMMDNTIAAVRASRARILLPGTIYNYGPDAFPGLVTPNSPLNSITYPGRSGVGHDWAYLPDTGEAFAQLMEREAELEDFARFHFRGFWDQDGTEMIAAIRRVSGKRSLPVKALPWFLFKLASPFNETLRELYATGPLWTTPIQLDNTRLVRFLGEEPHTDLDRAVETTLQALGCLGK